jgi:hypothetical protein
MSGSTEWIGRQPAELGLVGEDGRIHGWIPDEGWTATERTASPELVDMLRRTGAYPVAVSIDGQPLYKDPRLRYFPIPQPSEVPRVNGLAKAARVFSFLGFLFLPFGIIGLTLGYKALGQIRDDDAESRSVARTGITVGWIFTGLTVLVVFLVVSHS